MISLSELCWYFRVFYELWDLLDNFHKFANLNDTLGSVFVTREIFTSMLFAFEYISHTTKKQKRNML